MKTYYEQLFEKETGKQSWLPTWSEKFNEPREYLNPEYSEWLNRHINEKILAEIISNKYNRRLGQVLFLFELCDWNYDKLQKLEITIKKKFIRYCPGDKEEIEKLLK